MSDPRHTFPLRPAPLAVNRSPRAMIRALISPASGLALTDFARIFSEEARSTLGAPAAHALAQLIERECDRHA